MSVHLRFLAHSAMTLRLDRAAAGGDIQRLLRAVLAHKKHALCHEMWWQFATDANAHGRCVQGLLISLLAGRRLSPLRAPRFRSDAARMPRWRRPSGSCAAATMPMRALR